MDFSKGWTSSKETPCGVGSERANTERLQRVIPLLVAGLGVRSVVDLGCGDMNWFPRSDLSPLTSYLGLDLVKWRDEVEVRDARAEGLPPAELYFCRDVMIHLPTDQCMAIVGRVKAAGTKWLMATTFVGCDNQRRQSQPTSYHVPLDLRLWPFDLGEPLVMVPEYYPNKYCSLWEIKR